MLFLADTSLRAQPPAQESLTEEFPGLTAKERSRIAKKEVEEAATDTQYQAIMATAEDLFRQQRYEDALGAFQQARLKRPYNVYPKVKIHDLEAMIRQRNTAVPEPVVDPPDPLGSVPPVAVPVVPATGSSPPDLAEPVVPTPVSLVPATEPAVPVRADLVVPTPVAAQPVKPRPAVGASPPTATPLKVPTAERPVVHQENAPMPKTDGRVERTYKEGNAYVIERTVTEDGHTTVYKRVIHAWGAIYHFRDGKAIDERVWKETFGGD